MRTYKRITLLCGHYGSGKTNIAVNMAFDLKKQEANVALADLDIVNPYFRAKDSQKELKREIQTYVKHRTAPYKYPRIIVFRDELPKTTSGKIRRNAL